MVLAVQLFQAGGTTSRRPASPTKFYQVAGYSTCKLTRSRQVTSGIVAWVKDNICSKFEILREMSEGDKLEAMLLTMWKND
jgi:hypothetical protein